MVDFILDPNTGDLDLGEGNLKGLQLHTDKGKEGTQRLRQALSINYAEWFVNVFAGLPYIKNNESGLSEDIRYYLGTKIPNLDQYVFSSLNLYIAELPIIDEFISSDFTFDRKTRVFNYTYKVKLTSGEVLDFPAEPILEL